MAGNGPLPSGKSDRDSKTGQFLVGNQGGRGRENPHAKTLTLWRAEFYAAIRPEDIRAVALVLVARARTGERWAVRELLDRCFGKPAIYAEIGGPDGSPFEAMRIAAQQIMLDPGSCEIAVQLVDRQVALADENGEQGPAFPMLPGGNGRDGDDGNGQKQEK